jgi:NTP pyrophosphatase (non-canonical NTP hydrolase)
MDADGRTFGQLESDVKEFCQKRDWGQFHNAKELSVALSTEVSEIVELFRYKTGEEIQETVTERREEFEDEIADVLFLVARISQIYDVDVGEAFDRKLEKTAENYPVEKSKGKNQKYTEY